MIFAVFISGFEQVASQFPPAPLPLSLIDDFHIGEALPLSSFGGLGRLWSHPQSQIQQVRGKFVIQCC
jgi:hypothetical protein